MFRYDFSLRRSRRSHSRRSKPEGRAGICSSCCSTRHSFLSEISLKLSQIDRIRLVDVTIKQVENDFSGIAYEASKLNELKIKSGNAE